MYHNAEFFTSTILNWQHLLADDHCKVGNRTPGRWRKTGSHAMCLASLVPAHAEDSTRHIIVSESMHHVYIASQNLPPKCRQVFKMVYVQGKSMKEIAAELNLSISTVKAQKARALSLLKKQLPYLGCLLLFYFL